MSAAEPAITPPAVNADEGAAVIDLNKLRPKRRGALETARGRWTTMATTPPDPDPTPLEEIAEFAERWMNDRGQTLTSEETAATFTATLELVDHTLKGAAAQDIISENQRVKLAELLEAVGAAPRLV